MTQNLVRDADGAFLKVCPNCGQASRSLGPRCPLCDHDYDPQGESLLDRVPSLDPEVLGGALALPILLLNSVITLVALPILALADLVRNLGRAVLRRAARAVGGFRA